MLHRMPMTTTDREDTMTASTEVLATLASLEDEKIRAVNARHGDDQDRKSTRLNSSHR